MSDFNSLLSEASQLPIEQRIELIEALWDTMPSAPLPPLSDEWRAEIQRRSADYDIGKSQPIPWEQVRADARRRAGLQN